MLILQHYSGHCSVMLTRLDVSKTEFTLREVKTDIPRAAHHQPDCETNELGDPATGDKRNELGDK